MIDENFWLDIGINTRMLNSMPLTWFREFKLRINEFANEKELLNNLFSVNEIDLKDNKKLKEIFSKPQAKEFFGLVTYLKEKIIYLKEYFKLIGLKSKYIDNPLIGLLHLFLEDKERLVDSYYYILYHKTAMFEIWTISPNLDMKKIKENLINNFGKLTKQFKLGENSIPRTFDMDNKYFLCFEKGKGEGVAVGYKEKRNLRKRGVYFLKFNTSDNSLEVRTGNPKVADMFFSFIKSEGYEIYTELKDGKIRDVRSLLKDILDYNSDSAKITEIEFYNLSKGVNCECKLKENDGQKTLKECFEILVQNGLIDTKNIHNLKNFTINVSGFSQKVTIKKDKRGLLFNITNQGLSEGKYKQIVRILKDDLGIELRSPYGEEELSKTDIFKNLIGKVISDLSNQEKEMYTLMSAKKLISSSQKTILICKDKQKHKFYDKTLTTCPKCGGDLIRLQPKEYIKLNEIEMFNFIKNRLGKIFNNFVVELEEFKIGKEKQQLLHIRGEKTEFYLYLYKEKITSKIIKKLEKSLIPTIRIIVDKEAPENKLRFNSEIYAYNLIFEEDNKIRDDIINNTINSFENTLYQLADDARKKLEDIKNNKIQVTGDEFEDLCYPVLRMLFYGIYKWGSKNKGKPVPDGLYGIRDGNKKADGFSMIYDCKYSSGIYDLVSSEKLKAKDYVKRTNQSQGIKDFSDSLSSYMIISNSINKTQFSNLCTKLFKLRSWNGKSVLLELEGLINLYDLFMKNRDLNSPLRFSLGIVFADYVRKFNSREVLIDKQVSDSIFDSATKHSPNINNISVLNHLETDIED